MEYFRVQEEIDKVATRIDAIASKIEACNSDLNEAMERSKSTDVEKRGKAQDDVKYFRDKELQLRDQKLKLQYDKLQLMDEKIQLMDEKLALMKKANILLSKATESDSGIDQSHNHHLLSQLTLSQILSHILVSLYPLLCLLTVVFMDVCFRL